MLAAALLVPAGATHAAALPAADPTDHADVAATVSDPVVTGLVTPLGLAVGRDGTYYVAETFAGRLTAVDRRGTRRTLATVPDGQSVAGVDALGRGTVSYTVTGGDAEGPVGEARRVLPSGQDRLLGDTARVELEDNPDEVVEYGFPSVPGDCAAQFPDEFPAVQPGDINPNAYALAILPDGTRVVADAGGNTLLRVTPGGRVSVLAVLPPVEVTVSADLAAALELPACTAGSTWRLQPVPTDVELGPDGWLLVSTLSGGPEDPALAALVGGGTGAVVAVHPETGAVRPVASGFLGAVDLAVAPDGTVYVAELFADRVSQVVAGGPQPIAAVPAPGAIEWARGALHVTTNVFPPGPGGQIVVVTP
jgi:sugar lactone lactonase YvrE